MQTQRFFLPPAAIDSTNGSVSISEPQLIGQIQKVLRLKVGDPILVLDNAGQLYHCQLQVMTENMVQAKIVKRETAGSDPAVKVTIAMPLLKGGRFEWAIQKLTELGVAQIIPMVFERSVIKDCDPTKLARWQAILKEASEQCERPAIPQIVNAQEFKTFCRQPHNADLLLICAERHEAPSISKAIYSQTATKVIPPNILIAIGPEGGFTAAEIKAAQELGFQPVSLGPRILRSETAAVYALAQIISAVEN